MSDEKRRAQWEAGLDETIEAISHEPTPLNERFAAGKMVKQEDLLQYMAALERRVARVEAEMRWARREVA